MRKTFFKMLWCCTFGAVAVVFAQSDLLSEMPVEKQVKVSREWVQKNTSVKYVKRHRLASFDKGQFTKQSILLKLNLFDDVKYKVKLDKVVTEGVENLWAGTLDDDPQSIVNIYCDGQYASGYIETGNRIFSIISCGEDVLVKEVEKDKLPNID